jgi:methyl-accepting chemotaxis protein
MLNIDTLSAVVSPEKLTSIDRQISQVRIKLLKIFCVVCGIGASVGLLAQIVTFKDPLSLVLTAFPILLLILMCVWGFWLSNRGHIKPVSWLLIGLLTIAVSGAYLQGGTNQPTVLGFLIPLAMAIVLLGVPEIILISTYCIVYTTVIYLVQDVFRVFTPPSGNNAQQSLALSSISQVVVIVPIVVAILVLPTRNQIRLIQIQNRQLKTALEQLEKRQVTGEQISQEVLSLASQLKENANFQAEGSQQQLVAITQIRSTLNELTLTAGNIAEVVAQANVSTDQLIERGRQIVRTTDVAVNQSEKGLTAIQYSYAIQTNFNNLYNDLITTLEQLTVKSANTRRILDILQQISSETHLLSLNASIEAAGAGEYGERFSVVAQEVKRLATQSSNAGQEVVAIVKEVEQGIQSVQDLVTKGVSEIERMTGAIGEAQGAIEEMKHVSLNSKEQADPINLLAEQLNELAVITKTTTGQQRTATQQVLDSLDQLSNVARNNTAGSEQVSDAAEHLEEASGKLKVVLAG